MARLTPDDLEIARSWALLHAPDNALEAALWKLAQIMRDDHVKAQTWNERQATKAEKTMASFDFDFDFTPDE